MEEKDYIVRNVSLTRLVDWLNKTYLIKKSGEEFTISDAQGYVKRGFLPNYLGGHTIEVDSSIVQGVKSYSIIENK
jgi:hypothetical protein